MNENPPASQSPISILLVDDTPTNLQVLYKTLSVLNHKLLIAKNGASALTIAKQARPSLILLDVMMPEMDGYEVCRRLKDDADTRGATIIFLSALDDVAAKVKGLELGAVDFVTKPFQAEEVIARVKTQLTIHKLSTALHEKSHALERELKVAQELIREANQRLEGPLLGESAAVHTLRTNIAELAQTEDTVLLVGTPGSGEEGIARAIHAQSARSSKAFIYVNCALAQSSLSSTRLFPVQSDATQNPGPSKVELADGGTIYLDLINELPSELQETLFKLISANAADAPTNSGTNYNVRVIAYSSHGLEREVSEHRFSSHLAKVFLQRDPVRVPSLDERKDDIPTLANYFVQQQARRLGKAIERIAEKSMARLCAYAWPGSIRELQNVIEREVVVTQKTVLEIEESTFEGSISVGGYKLTERLGKGGMGEVWRAKHELLARPAAVKLIINQKALGSVIDDSLRKRFQREAQVTAHLVSPHTVTLYDFGVTKDGALYYVMELLNGMDLRAMVERFGPLPPARVVHLLRQICYSLAEAHEAGLVHRDIKPENLFSARLGTLYDFAKILDFGIVKGSVGENDSQLTSSEGGGAIGTPAYMAPEAIRAQQEIDARTDLYSLGCAAYWMLTGKMVFVANTPLATMVMHVTVPPKPPSSVVKNSITPEMDTLVLRLLEKDPAKRYPSAKVLIHALDTIPLEHAWTQDQAEQWWRQNLPDRIPVPSDRVSSAFVETVSFKNGLPTNSEPPI